MARSMPDAASAPEFEVARLLDTVIVSVRDVRCRGECRHRSAEECVAATHLVFPYRGTYLRHVGSAQAVADANHVLLFNAGEAYQVSHPVDGGDASFVLNLAEPLLREAVAVEDLETVAQLIEDHAEPFHRAQVVDLRELHRSVPL